MLEYMVLLAQCLAKIKLVICVPVKGFPNFMFVYGGLWIVDLNVEGRMKF